MNHRLDVIAWTLIIVLTGCESMPEIPDGQLAVDPEEYIPREGFEQERVVTPGEVERPDFERQAVRTPDERDGIRPDFEEHIRAAAAMPASGREAYETRAHRRAAIARRVDETTDIAGDDGETQKVRTLDERVRPRPGFEEYTGEAAELPARDPEAFVAAANFETGPMHLPPTPEAPREILAPGDKIGIVLDRQPLESRVMVRGLPNFEKDGRFTVRTEDRGIISLNLLLEETTARSIFDPRLTVELTADRMLRPNGVSEAVAITRDGRLAYLAEAIIDRSLLSSETLQGLTVHQLLGRKGEPIFQGPDRLVYEVPVRVSYRGSSVELAPGQTGELRSGDAVFGVSILLSRHSEPRDSAFAFEGPGRQLDYIVWRK